MKNLLIQNARIIDPSQKIDFQGDVLIKNGKIETVSRKKIEISKDNQTEVLNAKGLILTPGWIDMHTHLRDPGFTYKETIATGSRAASAGGFTSIACMANTNPVNDNPFVTSYIYQKVAQESEINVYAIGAITKGLKGEQLAEIGSMWEAGIVGISDDGNTLMDAYIMRKAFDYSKRFDLVVITHSEDSCLKGKGVMNEGFQSMRLGLRGIPKASEEIIVARDILLAELTGAKLHVAHVSTEGSIELIRSAKKRGVKVTAEVTPHHLILTDEAVTQYDTHTKVAPPLREKKDVIALQHALSDGTIDVLASDHAPHAAIDKEVEYDLAAFGMVGLETAFPLYYSLVHKKKIDLNRMIEAMTLKPAEVLGLPKGTLKKGSDADITLFDPSVKYQINSQTFFSKSKNTPFNGFQVQARVCYTIVGGKIIYTWDKLK